MVTREDLMELLKNKGQEAVGTAVAKLPAEDVRSALMLMVMMYQKSDEINNQLSSRDKERIAELEAELENAHAKIRWFHPLISLGGSSGHLRVKETTDRLRCHISFCHFSLVIDSGDFLNESFLLFAGFRP